MLIAIEYFFIFKSLQVKTTKIVLKIRDTWANVCPSTGKGKYNKNELLINIKNVSIKIK
jgi:hypothetical protein